MRVLFDLTYVNPSSYSGIVIYAYRLLKGIVDLELTDNISLLVTEKNKLFLQKKFPNFHFITVELRYKIINTRLLFLKRYVYKNKINKLVKKYNVSLFFTPYLNNGSLYASKVPQIGVLHDAQGYILSKKTGLKGYVLRFFTVRLLNRINRIVTISNFAKSSILNEIKNLHTPIYVVYNSVEVSNCEKKLILENKTPYILYVNTLEPYKNLETLVNAFGLLKDRTKHNLIVKAKKLPYWDAIILPLLKINNITDRVFLIEKKYSNEKMASLFSEADLFVSPSLMEGFGFTPIEAAMHQVPVISSKESALFETTLGLLNYYEPADDFKELAYVIDKILINKPSKEELIKISDCFKQSYSAKQQALLFIKLFYEYK